MTSTFWKSKNVLISGYEGFLGSNLTKALLDCKANVFGLDIVTHRENTILTRQDLRRINVIKGSVENFSLISDIIEKSRIEFVFHLAAKSLVGECLQKPAKAFSTNIRGTWNILEASRNNNRIKAIVIASSDKAYGSHKKLPYKEYTALQGNYPYDVSKSCSDLIAAAYNHTYGLPVAITRCGNIYGPGDFNFSRIVPYAIKCALTDKTLLIRSDGEFTRDYIFVSDIVSGYILLAEKLASLGLGGEAFNFSNGNSVTVIGLVNKIYEKADKKPNYKILNEAKYEIKHQYLCSNKARAVLGWKPQYTLEKGLAETIKWYKNCVIK